jgi:hypothetical protein
MSYHVSSAVSWTRGELSINGSVSYSTTDNTNHGTTHAQYTPQQQVGHCPLRHSDTCYSTHWTLCGATCNIRRGLISDATH